MGRQLIIIKEIMYPVEHTENPYLFPHSKLYGIPFKNKEETIGNSCVYYTKVHARSSYQYLYLQIAYYDKPLRSGGDCLLNCIIPVSTWFYK